jgi:hypothetical protein
VYFDSFDLSLIRLDAIGRLSATPRRHKRDRTSSHYKGSSSDTAKTCQLHWFGDLQKLKYLLSNSVVRIYESSAQSNVRVTAFFHVL